MLSGAGALAATYHQRTPYAVVCPITSWGGHPFEVLLPEGLPIAGAVLADQVKSIDRLARRIEVVGRVPRKWLRRSGSESVPYWRTD